MQTFKKLLKSVLGVIVLLYIFGVYLRMTQPHPAPVTQSQPAQEPQVPTAPVAAPVQLVKDDNLKSPATGEDFVGVARSLEGILKVRHCTREGATIRCRVSMVKAYLAMTHLEGVLIYGEAEKFEGSGNNIKIIDLPGTIVQAPDFRVGSEGDVTLIVPDGAELVTLGYHLPY